MPGSVRQPTHCMYPWHSVLCVNGWSPCHSVVCPVQLLCSRRGGGDKRGSFHLHLEEDPTEQCGTGPGAMQLIFGVFIFETDLLQIPANLWILSPSSQS